MKRKIYALITAQESCKRIIVAAKEFAERFSADLVVLTVQPIHTDAKRRSQDMRCLTKLAKETDSNIRIIYNEQPLSAICKELERNRPLHIFTGHGSEKSDFLRRLRTELVGAPISVVGLDGVLFSLPHILEDILISGS